MKLNQNIKIISALSFPIIILIIWSIYLSCLSYFGQTVKLPGAGYDPRDLLSGKYILLSINWDKADCSQFTDNSCPKEKFEKIYRYYAPEKEAPQMENYINKYLPEITMEFSYRQGQTPILKEIYFDNMLWKDYQKKEE